ncbi:Putative Type IV conjugative transfer system pilin assembly protein TrbC [Desulfonema limicola]|uniref:Type IV conjugative transfer system pilin assembly protein TrbC n=1 Tax=Desulfonema limicola TaxID=45656 RepID=A0A975GF27_9BACT|nr:TrbC family F-type conjugative pilus assembly protein [Desulfonema limicola]QTA78808.1 Putative Type IV conjugative transfer system pilin assembly protein TrbC [Desulfonema limicola]
MKQVIIIAIAVFFHFSFTHAQPLEMGKPPLNRQGHLKEILGNETYEILKNGPGKMDGILDKNIRQNINQQKNELTEILSGQDSSGFKSDKDEAYENKRIYIFISSSMPDDVIRRYITAASPIADKTVFLMRGFVGGISKIKPTLFYISRILCKDNAPGSPECLTGVIDVNPNLFKSFNINKVPAVLYLPGNIQPCGCGDCPDENNMPGFISYGDASLTWHLAKIQETGKIKSLDRIISRLRNNYYDFNKKEELVHGNNK